LRDCGIAGLRDCGIAGLRPNRYQFLANCIEVPMGPKPVDERCDHDLFRTELVNLIDRRHELVKLGELIDWQSFADEWSHARPG